MRLAKVIGSAWTTQKEKGMENIKLLITQPLNKKREYEGHHVVAMDRLGAGVGELVLITEGLAAQKICEEKKPPIDAAVVGIIDSFEIKE